MTRQQLIEQIFKKKSFLCVGLDVDLDKIPQYLLEDDDPIFSFNRKIIDSTAPYTVAYKPNLAFYEAYGQKGYAAFEKTVMYIKQRYPEIFIIADAKRGFDGLNYYADIFLNGYDNSWVILLALTSNKGSYDFQQDADANGERLFEKVIRKSQEWGTPENMMYVVGATRGEMFKDVRKVAPKHFLLVPGVGAQGGSLQEVCEYGMIEDCGLLVNSSRGIIYADNSEFFADTAAEKAKELQQQMATELDKIKS